MGRPGLVAGFSRLAGWAQIHYETGIIMTTPIMPTYGRLPVLFSHGEGAWLFDDQGERYLDALSGISVCNIGHANPKVTDFSNPGTYAEKPAVFAISVNSVE